MLNIRCVIAGLLLFASAGAQAQSAEETLEWMLAKKNDIPYGCSNALGLVRGVEINETSIGIYEGDGYSRYKWSEIVDVKEVEWNQGACYKGFDIRNAVKIVSRGEFMGKPNVIFLSIWDDESRKKFAKAIAHMASLKGAKLVKNDLF